MGLISRVSSRTYRKNTETMPRGSRGSPFGSKRQSSNSATQPQPKPQHAPPKPATQGRDFGASMARGAAFGVGAGLAGETVRGMMGTSRYDTNQDYQEQAP